MEKPNAENVCFYFVFILCVESQHFQQPNALRKTEPHSLREFSGRIGGLPLGIEPITFGMPRWPLHAFPFHAAFTMATRIVLLRTLQEI